MLLKARTSSYCLLLVTLACTEACREHCSKEEQLDRSIIVRHVTCSDIGIDIQLKQVSKMYETMFEIVSETCLAASSSISSSDDTAVNAVFLLNSKA